MQQLFILKQLKGRGADAASIWDIQVFVSPKALHTNSRAHTLGRVLTTPLSDPNMERGGADLGVGSAEIPKGCTLMMLTLLTQSTHA